MEKSPTDVAKEFGLSQPRVSQIYNKMWKENCSMPSGEKIVCTMGKDRLIKIGHEQYEGYYTKKNGKVLKKRFEGPNAKNEWIDWRVELNQKYAPIRIIKSDKAEQPQTTDKMEKHPIEKNPEAYSEIYILRARVKDIAQLDRPREQVLFHSLENALYISDMMTRITGIDVEVIEYVPPKFWEGEE